MITQRLNGQSVSPLKGALIIAGLALSIVLLSWIERAVALSTGFQYAGFAVWILVGAEALAVTRLSVAALHYTLDGGHFIVRRVYGQSGRVIYDIPLDSAVAFGAKDEIFRKYGNAQTYDSAVSKKEKLDQMAIAYKKPGREDVSLIVIQPDDAMLRGLMAAIGKEKA